MLLDRLQLRHFRTYDELDLRLTPGVTLLHGLNGSGKTNLLEAIFVLATTKSFRARSDRELISWNGQAERASRFARIDGDATANGGHVRLDMSIAERPGRITSGEAPIRKAFKLNGRPARAGEVVGEIKAVLFSPDDVGLVTGSPSGRRRYMDLTLCQVDHRYLRHLQEYSRVLAQRNALLQRLRGKPEPASVLEFWDDKLVDLGVEIMIARKAMLRVVNDFAAEAYSDLAGLDEKLSIVYRPSLVEAAQESEVRFAELLRARMAGLQTKEIYQGMTITGPHRDDLQFLINGMDAAAFGSRGQQRSVALSLRLAEMRYMTNRSGEQPILLLDEVMAELDEERRPLLRKLMEAHPQVLVTSSSMGGFPKEFADKATVLRVVDGGLQEYSP